MSTSPPDKPQSTSSLTPRKLVGPALIVVGAVLALAFPDLRFFWFQGRPFGIVLVLLGVWETYSAFRGGDGR
ncbi:hypothetical protein TSST111916_00420 [Tsukamurella strandjordii]|uniref:hypothetical protein n=1 Tax=Tsukamurella TaxID=2060 RepID=UPI001C7CFC43|nr:hypothetical protein [Tsukamurella sp. TY48]GIZ98818.1 hypothetical protein TTY48_34300 [Tsukamurella sp. TY48]